MSLEVIGGSISAVLSGHGPVFCVGRPGHDSVPLLSATTSSIGAGPSLRNSFSRPTPLSDTHPIPLRLTPARAENVVFLKKMKMLDFW